MGSTRMRFVLTWLTVHLALGGSAYGHNGKVALAHPVEGIRVDGDLSDWPARR